MDKENNTFCRKIKEEDLEMIMNWRMQPEITKYMNTDPKLTLEGQKKWYRKIQEEEEKGFGEDRKELYWVLETQGVPVGVVSFVDWNHKNYLIHTGVYIAVKEKRSFKLTVDLQMSMYEFAFEALGVNKVSMEILSNNPQVIRLNERLGAHRDGILRQEINKNGEYFDLYLLSVLQEEWENVKSKVRYDKIEFEC